MKDILTAFVYIKNLGGCKEDMKKIESCKKASELLRCCWLQGSLHLQVWEMAMQV